MNENTNPTPVEVTSTPSVAPASTVAPTDNRKKIIFLVAFVVVAVAALIAGLLITQNGNVIAPAASPNQLLIRQTIAEVKENIDFPVKFDENTTWNDVIEKPNAIHYDYTLIGIDPAQVKESQIKDYLVTSLCGNKDTKVLLDKDINLEFLYKIENSAKTYFFMVNNTDCKK